MKFAVLKILFIFLPFYSIAHESNVKIRIFDRFLELPSDCVLYTKPSLNSEFSVRYICGVNSENETWIRLSKFDSSTSLNFKKDPDIIDFKESTLGNFSHYNSKLKHTNDGDVLGEIDMFCDLELCISLYDKPEGIYSLVKSQIEK